MAMKEESKSIGNWPVWTKWWLRSWWLWCIVSTAHCSVIYYLSSLLSSSLLSPSAPAFSPASFIYSPPLLSYTSPLAFYLLFFFQHSPAFPFSTTPLLPLLLLVVSRLSVEQPIQQQNKAAYSITHWLIKHDQNSAALRSTQQHHDTGLHWRVEVSQMRRRGSREKENVELEETVENKYAQDNISC